MEKTNDMYFKAVIAEKLERFEDVVKYLQLTLPMNEDNKENQQGEKLNWSQTKLELLTVAYKNLINNDRDNLKRLIDNKHKETQ